MPVESAVSSGASPRVVLEPIAKDQAPVLRNLLELYAYDFSEQVPLDIKPSGRFELPFDETWWTADGHYPFFVRQDGKLCGFALVKRGSRVTGATDVMDVAEFFVLRGLRRKNVGTQAAHAAFGAFPGKWEIRVRAFNERGLKFWSRALETWVGRPVARTSWSKGGSEWEIFRFEK